MRELTRRWPRRLASPLVTLGLLVSATGAGAATLHVVPFPGTPDASPTTQIIFSSLRRTHVRSVTVTGSRSGIDPGRLVTLPDGAGTAFVPRHPFLPGERVMISAALSSPAVGAAIGAPGTRALRYSFGVEEAVAVPLARRAGGSSAGQMSRFHSAPNLDPPRLTVTRDSDRASGDIFIAPFNAPQAGPMIVDGQGRLVWFRPLPAGEQAMNLQLQRYHGQPVLSWWQGALAVGHGTIYGLGRDVLANSSYRTLAVVHGGNGYTPDLHEFQITPQGTALLDEYVPVHMNLTGMGGTAHGTVLDCVVQELDIRTGQVLWEWHSLGHVPLGWSYLGAPGNPDIWWDYFHINSIEQLPGGNILISSRNTWSVYEISHRTGRLIWVLGGKHSSFRMGRGTGFEWQHDARLYPGGKLSLFDDASSPVEERQGSAKVLRLNTAKMTVRLVHRYVHSPALLPGLAGSTQLLPSGDVFVGWGGSPDFSEYAAGGRQLFNATFPAGMGSYRAFRYPWTGRPRSRPAISVAHGHRGALLVYVSWNGATQVRRWRVLGGSRPGKLAAVGQPHPRHGFETEITLPANRRYLAVQALGYHGAVLGTSKAHPT